MPSGEAVAVENQSEARHFEETEQPLWRIALIKKTSGQLCVLKM